MSRNTRTTITKRGRRVQRSKHQPDLTPVVLSSGHYLLCGCWSQQVQHTCLTAPPAYCTCGATTGEGCACPSPIGRVA